MHSFWLIVCFMLVSGHAALAQQYNFRNWTLEHGLPQSKVVSILQDDRKHVWVATRGGVSRFDGTSFQTFTKRHGLSSNNISFLFQDSRRQLWIGTADKGLNRYNGARFTYYGPPNGLPGSEINAIAEDAGNRIWVATNNGVYFLKDDTFIPSGFLPVQPYTALYFDSDNTMWAGSKSTGLYKLQTSKISHYTSDNSALPNNEITVIAPGKDNELWIGTASGIGYIKAGTLLTFPGVKVFVTGFAKDAHGNTWVASKNNGLLRINKDQVTTVNKANGLRTNNIASIAVDAENNIWIGTNGYGLQQHRSPWFLHYFKINKTEEPRITSLTKDDSGTIWVGTDNGMGAYLAKDSLIQFTDKVWSNGTSIYSMLIKNRNDMWVGTSQGAWRYLNGRFTHFTTTNGLPSNEIRVITQDKAGQLWFATANGVSQYRNNAFVTVPVKNDSLGHVYSIYEDSKENLWFGAEGGIYKYQEKGIVKATELASHTIKDITSITEDKTGTLYFGAFNYGILRYKPVSGESRLFSTADSLPNDGVKSLFVDYSNNLWVGTNNSMLKVNLKKLDQQQLSFKRYNSQDGFRGLEVCHSCITQRSDSSIWFGTGKGLTKYIATLDKHNTEFPELLLTDIKLFMRPTNWQNMGYAIDSLTGLPKNLTLPFNRNHITFDFHGINFSYPSSIRYRYKLIGYDDDWSEATDISSATYANLPPDTYVFNVIARAPNGLWTPEPLKYSFSVNAPLWRREWFMGLMLLLVSGIILAIIRLRERGLKKMNRLLDLRVQHRTRLLERKHLEKELLLKEIHHRVKNNLQIVISLLNLQARHMQDPQAQDAMQAIKSRVRSMSLLHERLYQLDNLAYINLENYFREICESLYDSYGVSEEKIKLTLRIPPIKLDIDTAITLGLIVNELVSNSLKYAFLPAQQGELEITLAQNGEGSYVLIVRDNGKGITHDFDKQGNRPFGLSLVASLSKKLDGNIVFENNNGTKTILYFVLPS